MLGLLLSLLGTTLMGVGAAGLWRERPEPVLPKRVVLAYRPEPLIVAPALPAPKPASAAVSAVPASVALDPEAAPPARVRIPALKVDSPLVGLRKQRNGTLEVPFDYDLAGWYRDGIKPGDTGPAVLVGHVDSFEGPAVFFGLSTLKAGDRVTVDRTDGSSVVFAVYKVQRVSKDSFPTARVYGDTRGPELRLLTCGGVFDERTKSYRDNVVVYARRLPA